MDIRAHRLTVGMRLLHVDFDEPLDVKAICHPERGAEPWCRAPSQHPFIVVAVDGVKTQLPTQLTFWLDQIVITVDQVCPHVNRYEYATGYAQCADCYEWMRNG